MRPKTKGRTISFRLTPTDEARFDEARGTTPQGVFAREAVIAALQDPSTGSPNPPDPVEDHPVPLTKVVADERLLDEDTGAGPLVAQEILDPLAALKARLADATGDAMSDEHEIVVTNPSPGGITAMCAVCMDRIQKPLGSTKWEHVDPGAYQRIIAQGA